MTRSRLLTILFALIVLAGFTPETSAHYDPSAGRWLERDPLEFIDGMNTYEATMGDPAAALDPGGTSCTQSGCVSASIMMQHQPPTSIIPGTKGCPSTVGQLLGDPDVQRALQRAATACGCIPTITCKRCKFGGKAPPPILEKCPKLILCLDKDDNFVSPDPKGTLVHELTHVRQWCEPGSRGLLDFCEEVICMEHEAYDIEGECKKWRQRIDPKTQSPYTSKNDCLCKRACDSVAGAVVPCMFSACQCRDKCMDLVSRGKCVGGHYVK